jgi:uncharacterized OB-fold protein
MVKESNIRLLNPRYFGDSPKGPVLSGSKCKSCGSVFFPKKELCTKCQKMNSMEKVPLSKKGRLATFAVSNRSHIGLETPYAVGYIELPEKVRFFSLLTQCEPFDQLKIGMEMEMVIEKMKTDEFGYDVLVYKFRPIK